MLEEYKVLALKIILSLKGDGNLVNWSDVPCIAKSIVFSNFCSLAIVSKSALSK